jgi:hypothetical protein
VRERVRESGGESREEALARLVAANTRPGAGDEERAVHRLILDAATDPARHLTEAELARIVRHIAGAGFDPDALERARGNLVGRLRLDGRKIETGDRLPPAEIHYLRHVVAREEWPPGTTLGDYLASAVHLCNQPTSRVFVSRYQGVWQCGVIGWNEAARGSDGQDWLIVDYRLVTGHWATVYQWPHGPSGLADPFVDHRREGLRWLRR